MPLGETLTILATLANAVQVLRTTNRPAETPAAEPSPAMDTMALMAFDFAKTSNEAASVRQESALSRLNLLLGISAAALLISAFLGAVSGDSPEGDSPLFIGSLAFFCLVCAGAIVLRRAFGVARISLRDFNGAPEDRQWESLERFVEHARRLESTNQRHLMAVELGTDGMILVITAQVVLAAVWLIS